MSVLSSFLGMAGEAAAAGATAAAAPVANPDLVPFTQMADQPYIVGGNFWMPEAASITADGSDWMFYAVLGLSIFCFIGITAATVWLCVKYRHRRGQKSEPSSSHNDLLEITWTIIPTIICVFLFVFGWRGYITLATPPQHALEVQVYAAQWNWQFTHPNGVKDSDVLYVPAETPVRLVMTSQDVLHSFWIPAFRIKQDVVPKRYSFVWFQATKPGIYRLYCTEYCGLKHSLMKGKVIVLPQAEYQKYLALRFEQSSNMSPEELGKSVYDGRCKSCHSIDGTRVTGPSWKGIFGNPAQLDDGSTITVDENYIRESIIEPIKKSRSGYPKGAMSSFAGVISDKEIAGVIAYIKSLSGKSLSDNPPPSGP